MHSVEQTLKQLLAAAEPLVETDILSLHDALNRVLAAPALARVAAPAFDNSAMDGYALRLADLDSSNELPLGGRSAAGQAPALLAPGTAQRILTGAAVPAGADAVCIQENAEAFTRDGQPWVRVLNRPAAAAHVRRRGEDFVEGSVLVEAGVRLQPQHLALCAAGGCAEVLTWRPVRIALFSSGDELVEPGQHLRPGQIYDSNRVMLDAMLRRLGVELVHSGHLSDDPVAIRDILAETAGLADLILTSGGVSVGEEDHLKAVVQELGQIDLWKIAVKPGKPLAFGNMGCCLYLGLPGNPVSSFVTFALFAAPLIRRLQGEREAIVRPIQLAALNGSEAGSREEYLRARWLPEGAEIFAAQGSHRLADLGRADGLVRRPAGEAVAAGDRVDFYPLGRTLLP